MECWSDSIILQSEQEESNRVHFLELCGGESWHGDFGNRLSYSRNGEETAFYLSGMWKVSPR